jgi:hypothetical protein
VPTDQIGQGPNQTLHQVPQQRLGNGWLIGLGALGVALLLYANHSPLYRGDKYWHDITVNKLWSHSDSRLSVLFDFLLPILAVVLVLLLVLLPAARRAAAATGLLGLTATSFVLTLSTFRVGQVEKQVEVGRAIWLTLLGTGLLLAVALLGNAGSATGPQRPLNLLVRPLLVLSAALLAAALVLEVGRRDSLWYSLPLLEFTLIIGVMSFAARRLTRFAAGGMLLGTGLSALFFYLDYLAQVIRHTGYYEDVFTADEQPDPKAALYLIAIALAVVIILGVALIAAGEMAETASSTTVPDWFQPEFEDLDVQNQDVEDQDVEDQDVKNQDVKNQDVKNQDAGIQDAGEPATEGRPLLEATPPVLATEATRHLCVAMHLDRDLARKAMRQVIGDESRGIAPSLGIDFGLVVRHALLARHRQQVRDWLLAGMAVLALVELFSLFTGSGESALFLLVTLLLAWAVVAVEQLVIRYRVLAGQLSKQAFGRRRPVQLSDAEEHRVAVLVELERGNVTPYADFFPFVGSGVALGGWSFAVSVLKGATSPTGEKLTPLPIDVEELYEQVRTDVDRLTIEGLQMEDRLYVDGEELAFDPRFTDPGPPARLRTEIDPNGLHRLIQAPERVNRVYRCIRIYGWDGEYVMSIYLNFARTGQGFFAEARYFLLSPVKPELVKLARTTPALTVGEVLRTVFGAAWPAMKHLVGALRRAWSDVLALCRRPSELNTDPDRPSWINYGAATSLRELAQSNLYRRYFQRLDRDMTNKIVERQLLDSIATFLRERQIDTSDVEQRQTAILNYGLIMSGGNLSASSVAVGTGAQSLISRLGSAVNAAVNTAVNPPAPGGEKASS